MMPEVERLLATLALVEKEVHYLRDAAKEAADRLIEAVGRLKSDIHSRWPGTA